MSKSPETERPRPKVIEIGQEFLLFPQGVKKDKTGVNPSFILKIGSLLPGLSELKMKISKHEALLSDMTAFCPYKPEMGYAKTPKGVKFRDLAEKLAEVRDPEQLDRSTIFKTMKALNEHELYNMSWFTVYNNGLFPQEFSYGLDEMFSSQNTENPVYGLMPEIRDKFRRLSLELTLPTAVYKEFKAVQEEIIFDFNAVSYHKYVLSGHENMPQAEQDIDTSSGLVLVVLREKLKEIKAKFVISSEPPKTEIPNVFKKAFE